MTDKIYTQITEKEAVDYPGVTQAGNKFLIEYLGPVVKSKATNIKCRPHESDPDLLGPALYTEDGLLATNGKPTPAPMPRARLSGMNTQFKDHLFKETIQCVADGKQKRLLFVSPKRKVLITIEEYNPLLRGTVTAHGLEPIDADNAQIISKSELIYLDELVEINPDKKDLKL